MIELDDVAVALEETPVVEGVSLSVDSGEIVGLIGPNGAGKTTLLRTIDGILDAQDGSIRIDGERIDTLSSRELARRIAVLSQSSEVHFDFSVRDIVAMGRTPYANRFGNGDSRASAIVESALERTDVTHLADRPITAVSGGERQRVLLARAVAQETPVLLLDEPTASLDINHQVATFELVCDLAADGKAILAAIHDLDLAARYCDRLVLVAGGEQLAAGPPEAVLTNDLVERAYGTRAAVRRDVLTGSLGVTALPDRPTHPGVRVHVIGYGGACGPVCRVLDRAGYAVSVGILSEGGPDHEMAAALDLPTVSVPPGSPIDRAASRAHGRLIERAALTVVAPFHVGPATLDLLTAAQRADRAVIVDEPPFDERNHAGREGRDRWFALCDRHQTVPADRLLVAVADRLVTDGDPASKSPHAEQPPADREI